MHRLKILAFKFAFSHEFAFSGNKTQFRKNGSDNPGAWPGDKRSTYDIIFGTDFDFRHMGNKFLTDFFPLGDM